MIDDADRTFGELRAPARRYPYLVVRWMAAVYGVWEIRIGAGACEDPERALVVVDPSYREGVPLSVSQRRAIIDAALAKSAQLRHRMCVVFAEDDAVYVEPDGRCNASSEAPRGGLRLDKVDSSREA
jgi:hypothetical protein